MKSLTTSDRNFVTTLRRASGRQLNFQKLENRCMLTAAMEDFIGGTYKEDLASSVSHSAEQFFVRYESRLITPFHENNIQSGALKHQSGQKDRPGESFPEGEAETSYAPAVEPPVRFNAPVIEIYVQPVSKSQQLADLLTTLFRFSQALNSATSNSITSRSEVDTSPVTKLSAAEDKNTLLPSIHLDTDNSSQRVADVVSVAARSNASLIDKAWSNWQAANDFGQTTEPVEDDFATNGIPRQASTSATWSQISNDHFSEYQLGQISSNAAHTLQDAKQIAGVEAVLDRIIQEYRQQDKQKSDRSVTHMRKQWESSASTEASEAVGNRSSDELNAMQQGLISIDLLQLPLDAGSVRSDLMSVQTVATWNSPVAFYRADSLGMANKSVSRTSTNPQQLRDEWTREDQPDEPVRLKAITSSAALIVGVLWVGRYFGSNSSKKSRHSSNKLPASTESLE